MKKTTKPKLKTYTVDVHYDAIATITVKATDELNAIALAEIKAGPIKPSACEFNGITRSCVTDVEYA